MAKIREVVGRCPMGCGRTLHLMPGGFIRCLRQGCPRPAAASEILADAETEHVVTLTEVDFTLRHPLRERLDDALVKCDLHRYLVEHDRPPEPPGTYRITDDWHWTKIEKESTGG